MKTILKVKNLKTDDVIEVVGTPDDFKIIKTDEYKVSFNYLDNESYDLVKEINDKLAYLNPLYSVVNKVGSKVNFIFQFLIFVLLSQSFLLLLFLL